MKVELFSCLLYGAECDLLAVVASVCFMLFLFLFSDKYTVCKLLTVQSEVDCSVDRSESENMSIRC